jgi:hypothetical protein
VPLLSGAGYRELHPQLVSPVVEQALPVTPDDRQRDETQLVDEALGEQRSPERATKNATALWPTQSRPIVVPRRSHRPKRKQGDLSVTQTFYGGEGPFLPATRPT